MLGDIPRRVRLGFLYNILIFRAVPQISEAGLSLISREKYIQAP